MRKTCLSCINRRKSRGLLWVTLLFLLEGCNAMPNSKEEEINKAPKESEPASERCERMKVTVDERARQKEQAIKESQAKPSEDLEEAHRRAQEMGVRGSALFMRSNTAAQFVTRPEDNDDYLSVSSKEGYLLTPQEILDNGLNEPEAVLTPNQSIALLNHCVELGEQNAAPAAGKTVSIFAGNTGVGKSTTLNALLGCRMKAVRPIELGLPGLRRIVAVDPESPLGEILPIGHHGRQSKTFLPKIVQTPGEPNSAYCDCPGFFSTRGAEISIANAINIRTILQQATGVKAVFLASYNGFLSSRGSSIRTLEDMCRKMFGGADNLRKYQNSVLLGITKAPFYEDGEPLTQNTVRELLTNVNSDIAAILANRIFLFDPLDRATDNPHFWSMQDCRTAIARLERIPQRSAITLFQTTLTDSDQVHLLTTVRQLQPKIIRAITQGDVTALGQHWQLLQRLRVVEHPEVDQLIEGQVFSAINVVILQKADALKSSASAHKFRDAADQLFLIKKISDSLDGAPLVVNIDTLRRHLDHCREQYAEQKRMEEASVRQRIELLGLESRREQEEMTRALMRGHTERMRIEFAEESNEWGCLQQGDFTPGCSIL